MMAVPPPLMVPTAVTAALAATGCDASIATVSEIAGMKFTSLFIMCVLDLPVIASVCSAMRSTSPRLVGPGLMSNGRSPES
jgi:hypothetical protein